jgi:hypothetical protein
MADILEIASRPGGDGFPVGNEMTPLIQRHQVEIGEDGIEAPLLDDNAAATVVWYDFQRASAWLEEKAWLSEWQYIDYLYQSPNFEGDWRAGMGGTARISRFNVAKNSTTMGNQTRRAVFADQSPFLLEPEGKLAEKTDTGDLADPDAETLIDAATHILNVLDQRADFEYNLGLLIDSQALQGTGIGVPRWDEKDVVKLGRRRKVQPPKIDMPTGEPVTVNTWESDDFEPVREVVTESWPTFEFRRLGMTVWDEKWNTPNRPDLSAHCRIDVDYVVFQDLQQMRGLDCYFDIPEDDELLRYFIQNPYGDALGPNNVAREMNGSNDILMKASGEERNTSQDPLQKPMMKIAYWTKDVVYEMLVWDGRRKIIRNERHDLGDHALGYSATWWNIGNSGYGLGIGRINAGDQRMNQGVLNEVLKMIAYWTNAPLLYNTADGNTPTQDGVFGLGQMWGLNAGSGTDIRKAVGYIEKPTIPAEAWKIMELAQVGGADEVGANQGAMQGQITSTQGMARTATGANRAATQADAQISDPVSHLEGIIVRWNRFKWQMVQTVMPIPEIRAILSKRFSDAVIASIDAEKLLSMEFNIKVLAGQKLAAKAAISQLIPFLLQLLQQPQLMEYMHQKGWTINFLAIERIFLRVSELQGAEDIIVPLSDAEKAQVAQLNPNAQRVQAAATLEKIRGANKLQEVQAKGTQDLQNTMVEKIMDKLPVDELGLAEGRLERNQDTQYLQQGVGQI